MTTLDFWEGFTNRQYAVHVSSRHEHDIFMSGVLEVYGDRINSRHNYDPSFPYLYFNDDRITGWTGAGPKYARKKIEYSEWAMSTEDDDELDISGSDLSEVL